MIIWINGSFGSGKTTTAAELNKRLNTSFIFDPENTGYYIRENLPKELYTSDFQDIKLWRDFNFSMLSYMKSKFDGVVIVPMTIVNPEYFESIVTKLRVEGHDVRHFTLIASRETLFKRLRNRGDQDGGWTYQQVERCIAGLSNDIFEEHIITDELEVRDIVDKIIEAVQGKFD
jgi:tRNA uridine 5-carbamoylmethylation protein Kti12